MTCIEHMRFNQCALDKRVLYDKIKKYNKYSVCHLIKFTASVYAVYYSTVEESLLYQSSPLNKRPETNSIARITIMSS